MIEVGVRLNLNVDDDIPAMLTELAGGERKRGEKVSEIVRALYQSRNRVPGGSQVDRLEYELSGITGRLKELDGRLLTVERELAAVIADRLPEVRR